ncbi:hypothetical protein B0T14DRAFT_341185 [Immersiella caudata]|uniref:Uncharacterized protein n=1 Tax=Immersiella caudata TaxID=314043 RepID=A0AA39U5D4_9PEZI|nr:hypothetical protein B0T14DRAFT_341185 [Immersiella caudata]
MTLLTMGLRECIHLHIPRDSSDTPGLRRDRMSPLEVLWTLWLRCIVFLYASVCPFLLIMGPWGLSARRQLRVQHEIHRGPVPVPKSRMTGIFAAEVILVVFSAVVATIMACLVVDAMNRLVEFSRGEKPLDLEKSGVRRSATRA